MHFAITEPGSSSPWELHLGVVLPLGLFIGVLLLLWQRRSPHDARDVLHAAPAQPVRHTHPLLAFAFWAVPAVALLLPLIAGMGLLYAFLFHDPVALMWILGEHVPSASPRFDLLTRDAVLVSLVIGAGLVLMRQLRGSKRDVLGVSTRTRLRPALDRDGQ